MGLLKKRKNDFENQPLNDYDLIMFKIIKNNNFLSNYKNNEKAINKSQFLARFNDNIKKGSFLGVIFPCVLFLLISLISFSLVVCSRDTENFGVVLENENVKIGLIFIGIFFLVLSCCLIVQNQILKIKCIKMKYRRKNRYININQKQVEKIISFIDKNGV